MRRQYVIQPRNIPLGGYKSASEQLISDFSATASGTTLLAALNTSGQIKSLGDLVPRRIEGSIYPGGNGTTLGWTGITTQATAGTATARTIATNNIVTRSKRIGYVSAAGAGSVSNYRLSAAQYALGNGTDGGFFMAVRFACSDAATVSGARQWVGMSALTTQPTNVEPSTLTDIIAIGNGAADTNLKIFYGGSAAQTPIDLGANFPANTLSVDLYEFALFSFPELNNKVGYYVSRLNTGHTASGILTAATPGTQLPASTTLLTGLQMFRTNNATALAVGFDLCYAVIGSEL